MDGVAAEQDIGSIELRNLQSHVPCRVSGQGHDDCAIGNLIMGGNCLDHSCLKNRQDAIVIGSMVYAGRFRSLCLPIVKFFAANNVSSIGKGWRPTAVFEPGVPTDVIGMEVCAHDNVYVFGLAASLRQLP